jgi:presqualene diphosphate synthase
MSQPVTAAGNATDDVVRKVSGSSFYAAMRMLPKVQRAAMFEIYAFCRAVDDIADDPCPPAGRMEQLQRWRGDIHSLYAGSTAPHLRGLKSAIENFDLRPDDFLTIIDGMEMDVGAPIRAPEMSILDLYCDRVASAVGRLSVRIFGIKGDAGVALAHQLGRALQLTNILRDLDEDAAIGRLYLPSEALRKAGITAIEPASVLSSPEIGKACAFVAEKARYHFQEADRIMARCPRRNARTPNIMAEAYKLILDALEHRGWKPPRHPVRVGRPRLLWILLRHAF